MLASTSPVRFIRLFSLLIVSWLFSMGSAHAITLNAPIGQESSLQITTQLLGFTANPDNLSVNVFDLSEVCSVDRRDVAAKELDCQTETFQFDTQSNTLTYTPSSTAESGDTYQLSYNASADYFSDERTETDSGVVIITVTGGTSTKDAVTVFEDEICDERDEEVCAEYTAEDHADSINPDEVVAQYTVTKELISAQTGNVFGRINELRSGQTGASVAGLTYTIDGEQLSGRWLHAMADSVGGAAGGEDPAAASKWGFFINGSITDGEKDETDLGRAYETDASTVTIGVDYRFTPELIAGIAYGISESSLDFDGSNDDGMDNDMNNVIIYGTWYKQSFNVDLLLGASQGEIETTREILLSNSTAEGETDTDQIFFSISSGYDFTSGALSYGPFASFDYVTGEIEGYDETNGGGLEVGFDDQDIDSQVLTLGGRVSYAISTEWGVIAPHARAEWKKEFDDNRDVISGNFVEFAGSNFEIEADDFDDNWFHAGIGVSATFRYGLSAYIDYDSIIAYDDTELTTLSYGGRWEAAF